jgi:hypothetical protein
LIGTACKKQDTEPSKVTWDKEEGCFVEGEYEKEEEMKTIVDEEEETPIIEKTETEESEFALELLSFTMELKEDENGELHAIYVISDKNGKEIQIIDNKPYFTKDWYLSYSGNCCQFSDVNFDGKLDVITRNSGADVNAYNYVYLWTESEKQFIYSEEASAIANLAIDSEKEQIFSFSRDAGLLSYRLYEVKNDKIAVVASLTQEFNQEGTIIITETIEETGKVTNIQEESQLDSIWDGYEIQLLN